MDTAKQAEFVFYRQLDPFYYLKAAAAFEIAAAGEPPITYEPCLKNGDADEDLQAVFSEGFESSMRSHIHLLRYQQSEFLLSLVLGGYPHGPFYRFITNLRYRDLYRAFEAISNKEIPCEMGFSVAGERLKFEDWMSVKIVGSIISTAEDRANIGDAIEFLAVEAGLVGDPDNRVQIINGSKHGCRVGAAAGKLIELAAEQRPNEKISLEVENALSWGCWTENDEKPDFQFGATEFFPDIDLRRIAYAAFLAKVIQTSRLIQLRPGSRKMKKNVAWPTKPDQHKPGQNFKIHVKT